MTNRFKGVRFSFYKKFNIKQKNKKSSKKDQYVLNLRISDEVQKHLKAEAGDRVAIMHDFGNEYILFLKNIKNINHQNGFLLRSMNLTKEQHKKRKVKLCLVFSETWTKMKKLPKHARKTSIAKYKLLPNNTVLIDLGLK